MIAAAMKVSHLRCVSWIALLSVLLRTVAVVHGDRDHCETLIEQCDVTRASSVLGKSACAHAVTQCHSLSLPLR